ncbi:NRDE family protein [Joostella sp. CR20]|uniref:NRDE family protein n=1 Tax=Joostella sp. CR20 TaxID=2804312 RepID=UPI00313D04F6
MCTVSYIPAENGFYLTSNRDESPKRKTLPPQTVNLNNGKKLIAPIDEEKGGSWIATDGKNKVACILNGGFEKHTRILPYRKSRGHFVFEAFQYPDFTTFSEEINLENIEPFTLILIDDFLQVLVWDGTKKHLQFLSKSIPQLWSSSTLYSREIQQSKKEFFQEFLAEGNTESNDILKLHQEASFVLKHPEVQTVSTTQIIVENSLATLQYFPKEIHQKEFI